MKNIIIVIFFCINAEFVLAGEHISSLDDINSIAKKQNYSQIIKTATSKIKLKKENVDEVYYFPAKMIITDITYSGIFNNKVSNKNALFLENWLENKHLDKEFVNETDYINSTFTTLTTKQIDLFFDEIIIIDKGRRYDIIVQKPLAQKMHNDLSKNTLISAEFLLLGYSFIDDASYVLMTNFSESNKNDIELKDVMENDYLVARKALENNRIDYAISKLEALAKKYPDEIIYKKDICNTILLKNFRINTKIPQEIINCYNDILTIENDAEVNYVLATIYYNDNSLSPANKNKLVLKHTTEAINVLNKGLNKMSFRESEVYYNSLYLRGIIKLSMRDSSAMFDFNIIQAERPDLINTKYLED